MPKQGGGDSEVDVDRPAFVAHDPHLVECIARVAAFHNLPVLVIVQMTLMASELRRRPAADVHVELERRIAQVRAAANGWARPSLALVNNSLKP